MRIQKLAGWPLWCALFLSLPTFLFAEVQYRGFQAALSVMNEDAIAQLDDNWGTNVIKFQVGDNGNQDDITNMDDYRSMMDPVMDNLDEKLETICAGEQAVVLALLSPPGGFVNRTGGNVTDGTPHYRMFSEAWAQEGYLEFIGEFAERYSAFDCVLGIELLNEPAEDPARSNPELKSWEELVPDAITSVRTAAPNARIFVKPLFANIDLLKRLPAEEIDAANGEGVLYYVFNYYPDIEYAHAGLDGIDIDTPRPSEKSIEKGYCKTLSTFLRTYAKLYKKGLVSSEAPALWMGETAVIRWASEGADYLDHLLSVFEGGACDAQTGSIKKKYKKKIKKAKKARNKKLIKKLKRQRKDLVAAYQNADTAIEGYNIHAYRESSVWSFEYSDDPDDNMSYAFGENPSQRDNVLLEYFSLNN